MGTATERARRPPLARRLQLGQLLALVAAGPALVVIAAVIVGIITISHQGAIRANLLERVEPANAASLGLLNAMLNQETGIRGFELTGERRFLQPYYLGVSQARTEERHLRNDGVAGTGGSLAIALNTIHVWESRTAGPALRLRSGSFLNARTRLDTTLEGKRQFDAIRTALGVLQDKLAAKVRGVKDQLNSSANVTEISLSVIAAALVISVLLAGLMLRWFVTKPVSALASSARRVAGGDLTHSVVGPGPRDLARLASDVDAMRLRLLSELTASQAMQEQLADAAADLQRSNTELEQFAYVASHDLQEPLRKVASFCQLLEARYGDQFDERGHQYIAFAVDGAKRMQQLINDLLAFSRVGRQNQSRTTVELNEIVAAALADLDGAIKDSGAEISVGPLPTIEGEPALLRAVFQNLLANAIKFRSEDAPRVTIEARREGEHWLCSCTDNGIGIEPEYAERIFVIFQRLHTREAYPGTGIGLAMCRKIIEHHDGRMWLDPTYTGGTRMCFTLPAETPPTIPASPKE